MTEIISLSISFISFLGLIIFILRKIPVLAQLSIVEDKSYQKDGIILRIVLFLKEKTKNIKNFLKSIPFEIILQKILSKIRILALKIENKIASWLSVLRKKSIEKKNFSENYWKKLIKKEK